MRKGRGGTQNRNRKVGGNRGGPTFLPESVSERDRDDQKDQKDKA